MQIACAPASTSSASARLNPSARFRMVLVIVRPSSGPAASDSEIGGESERRAGAGRHAVEGRDDDLRRLEDPEYRLAGQPCEGQRLLVGAALKPSYDLLDVAAGAEGAARAGQDDDAQVGA